MGRPSSTAVPTTENYTSMLDVHMPEVDPKLYVRYAGKNMLALFEQMGRREKTEQSSYKHAEEEYLMENITVQSNATAGGAGQYIDITLAVADHYQGTSFPQKGMFVIFKSDNRAYIYSKDTTNATAHVIRVYPSQSVTLSVTAGETIAVFTNAYREKSDQPQGVTPRVISLTNNTQIFKETLDISGTEMTNKAWYYIEPANGRAGGYMWGLKAWSNTYKRFMQIVEGGMVFQDHIDPTVPLATLAVTDGGVGNLATTEGMIPFIKNQGGLGHNTGGTSMWNMAQLDSVCKKLDKNYGSAENSLWSGFNFKVDWDNNVIDTMKAGSIIYGQFNGNKDMSIYFGFSSIEKNGYTFHNKKYDVFTDPKGVGSAGFIYSDCAILIPVEKTMNKDKGGMVDPVRVRFKKLDTYSREMEHWLVGTAGVDNKQGQNDSMQAYYRCDRGFEGFAPNRFMFIQP